MAAAGFVGWWNKHEDYIADWHCCEVAEAAWLAAVEFATSHNTARVEICGDDVCEYCAKHGKCFGTQHFPECFVGRKLSPVA